MLIGELAAQSGLSKDTIRFYEKMGLIKAGERRAGSRTYKEFDPTVLDRLSLIQKAKRLGFKLNEIRQTLDSWQSGELSYEEKIQIIEEKMSDIDAQVEQLLGIKAYLDDKRIFLQQKAARSVS